MRNHFQRTGRVRKTRFRGAGLAGDAFTIEVIDQKARRRTALVQLAAWLGFGEAVTQGSRLWITYASARKAEATARIQELQAQEKLRICTAKNGAVCLAPNWARVTVNGVVIEVLEHESEPNPVRAHAVAGGVQVAG